MINVLREPTQGVVFGSTQQRVDLAAGVFLEKLSITLDAVVDIAIGGGTDGTIIADGVARLIRRLIVKNGTETIGEVSGRDLLTMTRAGAKGAAIVGTQLTSAGISTQTVSLTLNYYFARPWLVNGFETVLPPMRGDLYVLVDWAQDAAAGNEAGTGVLITGGTRVITFTVDPTLTITQYGAMRGKMPWYLPYYTSTDTEQFTAANAKLLFKLADTRRFDSVFISARQGALAVDADLINSVTLGAQGVNFINAVRVGDIRADQRQTFPAASSDLGLYLLLSEGGWLGNAVEPTQMVKPLFTFDVDVPGSNPGIVHLLFSELISNPEYTLV